MREKHKTTSPPKSKVKTQQRPQAKSAEKTKKIEIPQDSKNNAVARVAASAQKARKKKEIINALKYPKPETSVADAPTLKPQSDEDSQDIYFRALGVRIAQRAYALYEARGGGHGHDLEDWMEAEQQIFSEEVIK